MDNTDFEEVGNNRVISTNGESITPLNPLLAVQAELKAPKNQRNTFGNYNYRSAEDILEAVKPLNAQYGVLLTVSDEVLEIGGRIYVRATATAEYDGGKKIVTGWAREAETKKKMDVSQITGSASSYARKYALNGLYLIDDTKDADTNEQARQVQEQSQVEKERKTKANKMTNDMISQIVEIQGLDTETIQNKVSTKARKIQGFNDNEAYKFYYTAAAQLLKEAKASAGA